MANVKAFSRALLATVKWGQKPWLGFQAGQVFCTSAILWHILSKFVLIFATDIVVIGKKIMLGRNKLRRGELYFGSGLQGGLVHDSRESLVLPMAVRTGNGSLPPGGR